eukprot:ANDGO_03459.mRNA.1 hypothetical protein
MAPRKVKCSSSTDSQLRSFLSPAQYEALQSSLRPKDAAASTSTVRRPPPPLRDSASSKISALFASSDAPRIPKDKVHRFASGELAVASEHLVRQEVHSLRDWFATYGKVDDKKQETFGQTGQLSTTKSNAFKSSRQSTSTLSSASTAKDLEQAVQSPGWGSRRAVSVTLRRGRLV